MLSKIQWKSAVISIFWEMDRDKQAPYNKSDAKKGVRGTKEF